MKHFASPKFWALYEALPLDVRDLADKNYELLKSDSRHPSLHFKKIDELWSVRVGLIIGPLQLKSKAGFTGSGSEPTLNMTGSSHNRRLVSDAKPALRAYVCAPQPERYAY